jgi:predicted amidohydrolase
MDEGGFGVRFVNVAVGQLGPIARNDTRAQVVARLTDLMRQARSNGCDLIVYPELALTTFFPRWYMEDQAEIDGFFEREMPGPETQALFDLACELGIGFCLGYGELAIEDGVIHRYNSSILADKRGAIVAKYRKVHLPGHAEHEPWREFQHLEKRYFEPGDLAFRCGAPSAATSACASATIAAGRRPIASWECKESS